jgi:hypothetical protein
VSYVTDGALKGLRSAVGLCVAIVAGALTLMVAIAADSWLLVVAVVTAAVLSGGLSTARVTRWRAAIARRRLRRRVGDPHALSGHWRRLLTAAWAARDEFCGTVVAYGSSPLGERLADHQMAMDAALERCGALARRGHRLLGQLRAFRTARLRRELLVERHRDRHGDRAAALARRLDDIARLRAELERIQLQLEEQVHDMRTAAWRASTLRLDETDEPDRALTELLDELAHLRAALHEVDRPRAAAAS